MNPLGLFVLRVGTGVMMLPHGIAKAKMLFAGNADKFLDPIGWGKVMSLTTATMAELVGSALLILGLMTRVSAISLAFTMGIAAFIAHGADPWFSGPGVARSKEPALVYMFAFLAIAMLGAGKYSMDAWLAGRKSRSN